MKTCCIKDCSRPVSARGMCAAHYQRLRRYGDPTQAAKPQLHGLTVEERFNAYVAKGDGCWEWQSSKDRRGYGRLSVKNIPVLAHRLSWEFHCYPIPDGMQVLHRCDNPGCVRPDHLFLGDHTANMADMNGKGRGRPGLVQGEKHGCSKLTEQQVREIRSAPIQQKVGRPAANSPETLSSLARRYGISRTEARDIRAGKLWRHIE